MPQGNPALPRTAPSRTALPSHTRGGLPRRSQARWLSPSGISLRLVGIALTCLFAFPGAYLIYRNFTEGADPLSLLFSQRTIGPLMRTLRLAVTTSIAAGIIGTTLAWLITRTDLVGRRVWAILAPLPLVFPTFIGAAAFIRTLNPGGLLSRSLGAIGLDFTYQLRGFWGAWLVLTLFTYPYVFLPVAARLRNLSGSLEENARVLGQSPTNVFLRVVLPQIAGAIAAGVLLVFLYAVSDFGAVQLMAYDTLTRAIHTAHLFSPDVALALSLVLIVTAGLVVLAERSFSARLPTDTSARPTTPVIYPLKALQPLSQALVWLVGLLALGAPVASLADWAIGGLMRSASNGRPLVIGLGDIVGATWNTTLSAVLAAALSAAAVLLIALLIVRQRSRIGRFSHLVVISTFAVPGILIALALRFWTLRSDIADELLAGTLLLFVLAFVVRFAALAMGTTLLAVRAVPQSLRDSAKLLNGSAFSRFRTVELPLIAPGVLAGAGLVLLSVMKELPISLLLAPIGFPTLSTRIYGAFTDAFVAEAGILALVLLSLSFVLTWLLILRRAPHRSVSS